MRGDWKPFRIGQVEVSSPVVLASLAGYSDLPYRLICRRYGAPFCATEMLLDRSLLASPKLRNRLLQITPQDHPLAGQLIGNIENEGGAQQNTGNASDKDK